MLGAGCWSDGCLLGSLVDWLVVRGLRAGIISSITSVVRTGLALICPSQPAYMACSFCLWCESLGLVSCRLPFEPHFAICVCGCVVLLSGYPFRGFYKNFRGKVFMLGVS